MPIFKTMVGAEMWVPAEAVMRAESAPGGLATRLVFALLPDGRELSLEVEGTLTTVAAALAAGRADRSVP